MKAIVCPKSGLAGLKLEEIEKPTAGDNEVLIKVGAVSMNPDVLDCFFFPIGLQEMVKDNEIQIRADVTLVNFGDILAWNFSSKTDNTPKSQLKFFYTPKACFVRRY